MPPLDYSTLSNLFFAASDTAGSANDLPAWITPILNVGLVGIFFVLLATETVFITRKSFDRAMTDKDKELTALREDNEELKTQLQGYLDQHVREVVPTLTRAIDQHREAIEVQREYIQVLIDNPSVHPKRHRGSSGD